MRTLSTGVCSPQACSAATRPSAASRSLMYLRVCSMAAEPDGRGPMATSCRRCSHARPESNLGTTGTGTAACGGGCTPSAAAISRPAITKSPIHQLTNSPTLRSLLSVCVVPLRVPSIDLSGPRDLLFGVEQHFFPLGQPAGRARDGEKHREHFDGEAHRLVNQAGVEVDVRVQLARDEVVVLERDALQFERDLEEWILSGHREDQLGNLLDHLRARIVGLVDAMAES